MRLRDRIKAFFNAQKSSAGFMMGFNSMSYSSPFKYESYAQEGLRQNPVVYACIEEITGAAKKIGIVIKRNDELIEEPSGEELKIAELLKWPNPNQSMGDFIEVWNQQMNLSGMTFIRAINVGIDRMGEEAVRVRDGSIWLLPPNDMTIKAIDMMVQEYVYKGSINFTPDEVTHILFPDPLEMFEGLPPLRPGALATDVHNRMYQWNDNLLKSGGVPPIIIGVKGLMSLSQQQIKELMNEWDAKYAGSKNVGKPWFFPGDGFDAQKLGLDSNELNWLGGEALLARRICNVFKVPPQVLGDPDTSKYSNYMEARKALYNEKVLPDMRKLIGGLNRWLMPKFGPDYTLDLDLSDIDALRDNENERAVRLSSQSWWTINEKREAEGMPPVEGGDIVLQPFNLTPIGTEIVETVAEPPAKAVKTRSKANREWLHNESRRIAWEVIYQREVGKYFRGQRDRVLDRLGNYAAALSIGDVESKLDANQLNIFDEADEAALYAEELHAINVSLMIDFGESALAELAAAGAFDVERPSLNTWLTENLAKNSKTINETTANEIRKVLQEGLDLGEGNEKLAKRLQGLYSDFSRHRSRMIARTETGAASGKAKLEGYQQGGVPRKRLVTSGDALVRDAHAEADGQIVGIDEPFYVGGYATDTMPAQTGVAELDINCRCTFAPEIDRG